MDQAVRASTAALGKYDDAIYTCSIYIVDAYILVSKSCVKIMQEHPLIRIGSSPAPAPAVSTSSKVLSRTRIPHAYEWLFLVYIEIAAWTERTRKGASEARPMAKGKVVPRIGEVAQARPSLAS